MGVDHEKDHHLFPPHCDRWIHYRGESRMRWIAIFLFCMFLTPFVKAEGNLTLNNYDEQTQTISNFIVTITNGSSSLVDGRFSTLDTETDSTGFWTPVNIERACDYDTSTTATETCSNGGGCVAGSITLDCLVSVPYYTSSSHSNTFILRVRSNVNSALGTAKVQIYDESLGTFTDVITGLAAPTSTANATLDNINGRYAKDGTARVRITTTGGNFANGEVFTINDIWTVENYGAGLLPTTSPTTQTFFRSTKDDDNTGGLPLGSLTITLLADQYQTANDYSQRTYYTTESDTTNVSLNTYLLKTAQGSNVIYTTYYGGSPLSGVLILAQRNLNGSYITVDSSLTQSSGTGSHFLQSGISYQVIASRSGYGIQTLNIITAGSPYTINMQSANAVSFQTLFADISYLFQPINNNIQVDAGSNQSINLTLIAANNNLQSWGFNATISLRNGTSMQIFSGTSSVAGGGTITSSYNMSAFNVSNFDTISINAYIQRIGESPHTFSRSYMISLYTPGTNSLYTVLYGLRAQGIGDWQAMLIASFISLLLAGWLGYQGFGQWGIGISVLAVFAVFAAVGLINSSLLIVIALASLAAFALVKGVF